MQRCQLLYNQEKPTCVCKRPIPGQNGAFACPLGQHPDARCKCVLDEDDRSVSILLLVFRKCAKYA